MAGVILDTSVCIDLQRGDAEIKERLRRAGRPASASMVVGELLAGVELTPERYRSAERASVQRTIRSFRTIPFDRAAARAWARLAARMPRGAFEKLGAEDVIIAATAISRGMTLATRDEGSFPKIPGLSFEVW